MDRMALRRVFVDTIEAGEALARGSRAHHLARVVRLNLGERVEVSDQERAYRAVTEACSPREVRFRLEERLPDPVHEPRMDAGLALIKFSRFEWAIEKLTELGVRSIIPVVAERSDARLVAAASKRLVRWRRVASEAAQQSRRLAAPAVEPPRPFEPFVRGCDTGARILVDSGGTPVAELRPGGALTFAVGPEGGWTSRERDLALGSGFSVASLGDSVLRAETAAIAVAAICASLGATVDA